MAFFTDLLTAPSTQPSFSLQFSKGLYNQCTDFKFRESIGAEPLLSLLRNLPCGPLFPGCNGFNEKAFSWERSSGMMDLYAGNLNVIVFDKDTNSQNPQEIILSVSISRQNLCHKFAYFSLKLQISLYFLIILK